ncbi:MAG: sulfotransferase family 2 domain-containing protein [Cyanobacteria bacterium J06639_1]
MISLEKKFLFVHVPKTGGNSIQGILKQYSEDEIFLRSDYMDGVQNFDLRSRKYDIEKHSNLSHYQHVIEPEAYRSLYKFATIRNPWDKLISFCFSPHRTHRGNSEWDRDTFIRIIRKVRPLRYYICERSLPDKILEKFWAGIGRKGSIGVRNLDNDLDFLIRFERIDEDFKVLCDRLGIDRVSLPKRNASKRGHYRDYYDDELKAMVSEKFAEEIRLGDYSF